MKRITVVSVLMAAGMAVAAIIPVQSWPRKITAGGKVVFNPTPAQCVEAGYRLLQPAEKVPDGKVVATEKVVQDPNDPTRAITVRTYIDRPAPSRPEPTTNVTADRVRFIFTTNGAFLGATWLDAPPTNGVRE